MVAWNALPSMAFGDSEIALEYVERFTNYLRKMKYKFLAMRGVVMSRDLSPARFIKINIKITKSL